jgi:hypothetical protein
MPETQKGNETEEQPEEEKKITFPRRGRLAGKREGAAAARVFPSRSAANYQAARRRTFPKRILNIGPGRPCVYRNAYSSA